MLHLILYQPEIPPNTGNIVRLCANTGSQLHLVGPLGFRWEDRRLKRAGLDYHEFASVQRYPNWQAFVETQPHMPLWALSTRGRHCYSEAAFQDGDGLVLGPETRGLPEALLDEIGEARCLSLPMVAQSRSLNLSNAAAIVLYEAWRQLGFNGGARP